MIYIHVPKNLDMKNILWSIIFIIASNQMGFILLICIYFIKFYSDFVVKQIQLFIKVVRWMGTGNSMLLSQTDIGKLEKIKNINDQKALYKCIQSDTFYIASEKNFTTNDQLQHHQIEQNKRNNIKHNHVLPLIASFTQTASNICSKQHRLIQLYPYEDYTLLDQIANRIQNQRQFTIQQLWSIICSCVLAMGHYCRNEILHYTLGPQDIVIDKLGCIKICPMQISDYVFQYVINEEFYYSPQMLKTLKFSTQFNIGNKSGVFTLALTILHIIYLKPMSYLYDFEQLTIDMEELNKLIEKIQDLDLKKILKAMTKQATYQRICFTQLEEMIYGILQSNSVHQMDQSMISEKLEDFVGNIDQSINIACKKKLKLTHKDINNKPYVADFGKDQQDKPNAPCSILILEDQQMLDQAEGSYKKLLSNNQYCTDSKILIDNSNLLSNCSSTLKIQPNLLKKAIPAERKTSLFPLSQSNEMKSSYVKEDYNRGRYQGYKQKGMRHGFGTFYYQQGGKYVGEWKENKMQGLGALYYINGNLAYEGEWKQDKLNGKGVLYNENPQYSSNSNNWQNLNIIENGWSKYQGLFKEDCKHGKGTLFLTNGQIFIGEFSNDIAHGNGIYKRANGCEIKGQWNQGIYIGNQKLLR